MVKLENLPTGVLCPVCSNARKHPRKQVQQIATSIQTFGFNVPIVVNGRNEILAGHGRYQAALLLGLETVPCLRVDHLTEVQERAFRLCDNRIAEGSTWDGDLLGQELAAIVAATSMEVDVTELGFTLAEVDVAIEGMAPQEPNDPADDVLPEAPLRRCEPGDIWQLGPHRLICGDVRDPGVLDALMEGWRARMVFTDPPYNVPVDGHVSGRGRIRHREFAMASGEMNRAEFSRFLGASLGALAGASLDGAIHFVCIDWRHLDEMLAAGAQVYGGLKNLVVWVKDRGGMGSFYRSRHELVCVFKLGDGAHVNGFELGQHGRYRTNVWEYRGVTSGGPKRLDDLAMHPTVKPVQMIADAIRDVSWRGEIILDGFGGSGSTLIAAEKTGRVARVVEIDPLYCDVILARWEAVSKDFAERASCGWPRV